MTGVLDVEADVVLPSKIDSGLDVLGSSCIHSIDGVCTETATFLASTRIASDTATTAIEGWAGVSRPPRPTDTDGVFGMEGRVEPTRTNGSASRLVVVWLGRVAYGSRGNTLNQATIEGRIEQREVLSRGPACVTRRLGSISDHYSKATGRSTHTLAIVGLPGNDTASTWQRKGHQKQQVVPHD